MHLSKHDVDDLVEAIAIAVDEWVRAGGGDYEALEEVLERAILRLLSREE